MMSGWTTWEIALAIAALVFVVGVLYVLWMEVWRR